MTDRDLIIKTKIVERKDKNGKVKKYKEIVYYKDSMGTKRKKEIIKKINKHLNEQILKVKSENINIKIKINKEKNKNSNFLEDLYNYQINN